MVATDVKSVVSSPTLIPLRRSGAGARRFYWLGCEHIVGAAAELGRGAPNVGGGRANPCCQSRTSEFGANGAPAAGRAAAISIGPNVPVSDRVRLPCRWSVTLALPSLVANLASPIARARQRHFDLLADQLFNEFPSPSAPLGHDRVKPIVENTGAVAASSCEESGFVLTLVMP